MISLSQVCKRYPGGLEALKDITFTIETGEMVFITGHSGAGKSTLLNLIAAIEAPSSGTIIVNGQNLGQMRPAAIPFLRRNFGLIFQDHKLLYDRCVFDNVMLPLEITDFDPGEAAKRVRAALDKVGLLGREKTMPIALSGGEQQRLCMARAIVHRPAFLLADEPTANLDSAYASEILEMFKSFNQVGVTVLISTHDEHLIERFSARTLRLQRGELLA